MTARRRPAARPEPTERKWWDWSGARAGDPEPCAVCGTPSLLRHPDNLRRAQHKTCEPATPTD